MTHYNQTIENQRQREKFLSGKKKVHQVEGRLDKIRSEFLINCQLRALFPAKLSFKIVGEIKTFPGK